MLEEKKKDVTMEDIYQFVRGRLAEDQIVPPGATPQDRVEWVQKMVAK